MRLGVLSTIPEGKESSSAADSTEDFTVTEVKDFNLECSTEIYTSVKTYLYCLNSDTRVGMPTVDEVNHLDRAFDLIEVYADTAKNLVEAFLNQYLHPVDNENKPARIKKIFKKPVSNRKLRRQKYASFQKLYKKNRKAAYDTLHSKNSLSDELNSSTVFSFWKHL